MARLKKPLKSHVLVAEKEPTDSQPVIESNEQPLEDEASLAEAQVERVPLGRLLVDAGFLTRTQLDECLFEGSKTGERIGEVVVRRSLATEDDIARLLAEQWGLDYVERSAIWFDGNALAKLSKEDAQRWEALPTRVEGGRVVVAVAEPTEQRITAVRDLIGQETVLIVVPKSALDAGLRSSLLASRGGQFDSSSRPESEPEPDETPLPPAAVEAEVEAEEELPPPPPRLAPVPPLPDLDQEPEPEAAPPPAAALEEGDILVDLELTVTDDAEADAVQALAAEAQAVAERLAAQAASARQRAAEQHELRAQAETYEMRIAALEQELGERRGQVEKMREQLRSMLASLPE
jgi:hypothetical protein